MCILVSSNVGGLSKAFFKVKGSISYQAVNRNVFEDSETKVDGKVDFVTIRDVVEVKELSVKVQDVDGCTIIVSQGTKLKVVSCIIVKVR